VTTATGPGVQARPARNSRSRAPACRDDSPSGGAQSRSRIVLAHKARKASKGRLPSQFSRSRSLVSARTSRPVTDAMPSAVSRARRMGLLYRALIPRPQSHRPVQVACSRPVPVSPGSPGSGSFSACCTRYASVMPPIVPARCAFRLPLAWYP
jgi:hypothetical protein